MNYLTCVLLPLALIPALVGALPSTVVVNGVCLTCPNPNGDPVYLDGQEYRSFSSPGSNGNVVISRGDGGSGTYGRGRGTIYQRGGNTIVNGRCQHCNVDII